MTNKETMVGSVIHFGLDEHKDKTQKLPPHNKIILKFSSTNVANTRRFEQDQSFESDPHPGRVRNRKLPRNSKTTSVLERATKDDGARRKNGVRPESMHSAKIANASLKPDAPFFLLVETPRPNQSLIPGLPISITGLAVSVEPLKEIVVALGKVTELAKFGLYRPDLATEFPTIPLVGHAGFSCALQAVPHAGTEHINLTVTARTLGGKESKVELSLKLAMEADPAAESRFDGPVRRVSGVDEAAMRFSVDQALIDRRGFLRIGGWAIAYARIEAVDVFINDTPIGAAEYGLKRPDVEIAWPDYTAALNSGFSLVTDARRFPEQMQVKIRAKASGGVFREATIPVRRSDFASSHPAQEVHELVCDDFLLTRSGTLRFTGWAVSSAGIEQIRVIFEGDVVGVAKCGGERPDVGNKFPTIPGSRHSGFAFVGEVARENIKSEHVLVIELVLANGEIKPFKIALAPQDEREPQDTPESTSDFRVFVDEPIVVNGIAAQPVKAGLSIVGWALARDQIDAVTVELDHMPVGNAYYGMRREDIAAAFPGHASALLSGFAFSLPRRALTDGHHLVGIRVVTKSSLEQKLEFNIDVAAGDEEDGPWSLRRRVSAAERQLAEALIGQLRRKARFIIWLNVAGADAERIRTTLRSIRQQIYTGWTVVLVGVPASSQTAAEVNGTESNEVVPKVQWLAEDAGPSGLPTALAEDDGWIMPLEAGDVLSADALFEFSLQADRDPKSDLLYADERRLNPASRRVEAFFKPQWSPDLLWSTNYIGRPWCARLALVGSTGLSAREFLESGHYNLVLNCTEQARGIAHIPYVLGERRSDAVEAKRTEMKALRSAVKRRRMKAVVEPGRVDWTYRVHRNEAPQGLVSIIIPTCAARGLIKTCIESIRALTTHRDVEIICVDNIVDETSEWKPWLRNHADAVVEIADSFNWSRFNNVAAREASGSFLLFLNDDIEIIQPDWLEPLIELAARPEVGVVGPQLLYPDHKVQHAGLFLSGPDSARHAFRYCDENDPGYYGLALTQRNVIGLTGACMLMRAAVFNEVGGFDEAHAIVNNDVDFCLKTHAAKLWNVFTPFSRLIHHELASRAHIKDEHDESAFAARWNSLVAQGDPFFHRNLSKSNDSYQYEAEPVRTVFAGYPLYSRAEIKNILAIKVDHIGDFMTAFPAFQRIKERFPQCRLHVLAGPAACQLAHLEPAIDHIVAFEFFHARSGLGQKDIDEKQVSELTEKLASFDIDIAVDLRKQPDTRHLLKCAKAKWSAGFDWRNQFPWLDIALSWEGDTKSTPKRSHVADDLINLIDAIAAAGRTRRDSIRRPADWSAKRIAINAQLVRHGLYERPVVCLHPASGTEMRQWPPEYFAMIADGLIECEDVNVAVIGGPDERDIADRMLAGIKYKDRVTSLIGLIELGELPHFLETCALFVGNNSGPKHIAAALGVPTVGIHSGVVDPREWGPLGNAAVAIKRDMTCAPCYSAKREDCHRGLACLTGLSAAEVLLLCRRMLGARRGIRPQV